MLLDRAVSERIRADTRLMRDFNMLCDFGGRLSGTPGEVKALEYVEHALAEATGLTPEHLETEYGGWRAMRAELKSIDGTPFECHPLLRSVPTPPEGVSAEVVDVGRGTPDDFAARADLVAGRIVLVRHEYMFASDTIHRMVKYETARRLGAVGFLIAGPNDGMIVSGSTGRTNGGGIPGLGISPQTAAQLAAVDDVLARVVLRVETDEGAAFASSLQVDLPGRGEEFTVLSAHIDGHDLAESAMDNASGVAAVLCAARALAPIMETSERGLRVMVFTVEEWALTGSHHYVGSLDATERARVSCNINLDSVAGSPDLWAMTSDFALFDRFVTQVTSANGLHLQTHLPLKFNSDHANFAQAGIPALRLVAGFDDPASNLRHVLTPADTRDKVEEGELRAAAHLAAALVSAACSARAEECAQWRIKTA